MNNEFIKLFLKVFNSVEASMRRLEDRNDGFLHAGITRALKIALVVNIRGENYSLAKELSRFIRSKYEFRYLHYAMLLSPGYLDSPENAETLFLPDQETINFFKNLPDFPQTREEYITSKLESINL